MTTPHPLATGILYVSYNARKRESADSLQEINDNRGVSL